MNNAARFACLLGAAFLSGQGSAYSQTLTPDQRQLREIYQELVEIDTTNSAGSCTAAAQAMRAHLKSGGYGDSEMQIMVPPDGPKKGNLVVRLKGTGARKPMLLLAHIDVVEARREDWTRDPFKLVEEGGYFYARGASDDKAMAAVFVANMMRYKREQFTSNRDIILALTCDEEFAPAKFNGVEYLLKNHRNLIDAELALNEGGGGARDESGKPISNGMQAGEKIFQSFQLEVTNAGGHSSLPVKDNAIYHLADGLSRLGKFDFPFKLSDTTRNYFSRTAQVVSGQVASDMQAILRVPADAEAMSRLASAHPFYNASVRTTCVATMMDAGHATNALPQRARAVVNCRILPGESVAEVQRTLTRVMADDKITISPMGVATESAPPPLNPQLMKAVEELTATMWPGVPVIPTMSSGASDGRFLNNAGIWTYGVSGMFEDPDAGHIHGLNERLPVKSLYEGHEFLYQLAKKLSSG